MLYFFTVSPNLHQKTLQVSHCDFDDTVPRNNKDEGDTEKEGESAATDDRGTESKEEGEPYTADEVAALQMFHIVLKESFVKQVHDIISFFSIMIQFSMADHNHHTETSHTHDVCLCFREAV